MLLLFACATAALALRAPAAPQAKYAKRAGNATQRERLTNYDDVAAALRRAGLGAALRDELRVDVDPDVLELT